MFFETLGYKCLETYFENKEEFRSKDKKKKDEETSYMDILTNIVRLILTFIALYICFKRNNGFSLGPMLVAYCYPTCYIVFALATGGTTPPGEDDSKSTLSS